MGYLETTHAVIHAGHRRSVVLTPAASTGYGRPGSDSKRPEQACRGRIWLPFAPVTQNTDTQHFPGKDGPVNGVPPGGIPRNSTWEEITESSL